MLKLPEMAPGGYKDHVKDALVWYQMNADPLTSGSVDVKSYGYTSATDGVIVNKGIAKPSATISSSVSGELIVDGDTTLQSTYIQTFHNKIHNSRWILL